MKNRKGLIFALCAMMGAATFAGCADDSGNGDEVKSEFKVTDPNTTMTTGDVQTITASYEANTVIKTTSSDINCIQVNESVSTGVGNSASIAINALGSNCNATITVTAQGTSESKSWNISVKAPTKPYIVLDSGSYSIKTGETKTNSVTYMAADGTAVAGKDLAISTSNQACVSLTTNGVATNDQGKADISFTATGQTDCTATITITPSAGGDPKSFTVSVTGEGGGEIPDDPVPAGTPTLEFRPNALALSPDNPTPETVTVAYYNKEDNAPLAGYKVNVTNSDQTCVIYTASTSKTDTDGKVEGTIKAKGSDCTATLTATAGTAKAELTVVVSNKKEFSIRGISVKANTKYDKMGYVGVEFANVSCDEIAKSVDTHFDIDYSTVQPSTADGIDPVVHAFEPDECKTEDCFEDISSDSVKSFFAVAYPGMNNTEDVVGYGCTDVSIANDKSIVSIELKPVPTDLKGKYEVISNFDLTSGFKRGAMDANGKLTCNPSSSKANICVPKVEEMNAGDWVAFVVDFTKDPTMTLIEFVWSNALDRLKDISDNSTYGSIVDTILGAKVLAVPMIKDYVDKFLETMEWYKLFKNISADVNDLATNMQLRGEFDVTDYNTLTFEASAKETFTDLQYQWTSTNSNTCLDKNSSYNADTCRENMKLASNKENLKATMEGSWTGIVTDPAKVSKGDADLDINSHSLTFRWATILYRAVFGTILPKALGYEGSASLKQEYYVKAILEKLLFETVLKAYEAFLTENSLTDSNISKTYNCENFILGLVDWVYLNSKKDEATGKIPADALNGMNSLLKSAIRTVGNFVCNDIEINGTNYGLNGVDKLIIDQLDKIEAATTNGLMFSAKSCALSDNNMSSYQQMGDADEGTIPTANAIVNGTKTNRCSWTIGFSAGENKDVNLKGYFHAIRK